MATMDTASATNPIYAISLSEFLKVREKKKHKIVVEIEGHIECDGLTENPS